jgi:CubicO group peptidase (beta-lactamase class C family)
LCHKAGLAAVDGDLPLAEVLAWDPVVRAIAAQAPNWPPGTAHGYHARSFGWILGEVVRRVTGRSLGRFFADEIAGPLGLAFWIGVPRDVLPRCARIIPPERLPSISDLLGATALTTRVMSGPSNLFAYDEMWNRPDILSAEMPSSNGVGTARALALRLWRGGRAALRPKRSRRHPRCRRPARIGDPAPDLPASAMLQPMLAPGAGPRRRTSGRGWLSRSRRRRGLAATRMKFDHRDERTRALVRALYRSPS